MLEYSHETFGSSLECLHFPWCCVCSAKEKLLKLARCILARLFTLFYRYFIGVVVVVVAVFCLSFLGAYCVLCFDAILLQRCYFCFVSLHLTKLGLKS